MGKKQHSKDQLYLTNSESSAQVGRKQSNFHIPYKTLPFDCCAISFRPFETPMCTADGVVFDLLNIVPYLKKFRRHPVTGAPLAATDVHGDVLGFEERPPVSTDYVNDPRSSIVDAASTMVVGGSMVKIYAWYDNECGYSMRTAELARLVAKKWLAA